MTDSSRHTRSRHNQSALTIRRRNRSLETFARWSHHPAHQVLAPEGASLGSADNEYDRLSLESRELARNWAAKSLGVPGKSSMGMIPAI
jgi:hypothetical protein